MKKFKQILTSTFSSSKDAQTNFDPSGKSTTYVDLFVKKLLSMNFTSNEACILSMIPVQV
jgi:hypothetical protein